MPVTKQGAQMSGA